MLAYFLVAHPSLVQVYNFGPDVLRQLLCLAHGGNLECDCVNSCLLYSCITMQRVDTGVLGNELRLEVLLNGKLTGLWEPELLLVGRGIKYIFHAEI